MDQSKMPAGRNVSLYTSQLLRKKHMALYCQGGRHAQQNCQPTQRLSFGADGGKSKYRLSTFSSLPSHLYPHRVKLSASASLKSFENLKEHSLSILSVRGVAVATPFLDTKKPENSNGILRQTCVIIVLLKAMEADFSFVVWAWDSSSDFPG